MTKIVLLGDAHFGARNSNKNVEKWQNKFYDEQFFPYLKRNGIKRIFQMGDFFDNRKWINVQTLQNLQEHFINPLKRNGIHMDALVGNHDIPLKHSLEGAASVQLLSHYDCITVWDKPGTIEVDDATFTMMPWICRENEEEAKEIIQAGGEIILGHFEITGFVMHPGAISKDGISMSDFKRWDKVWSGHYHTQSQNGNINYLGTPYQMNWSDANTKHGFWVYDTTDKSLEFIPNKFRYFHRIIWDNGTDYDVTKITDGYVKVTVKNKTDFESFEKFIDQVNFNSPFELKVVESYEEFHQENVKDLITLASTEDLIEEYIDEVATTASKESVTRVMLEIYQSALTVGEET